MTLVHELRDPDELAAWRLPWRALWDQTPGRTFFQTLDWLEVYWRHFGQQQQLRVLVVQALGKPLGILPLVIRREASRLGAVRVLTYPLDYWGSFYGPLGASPTATLLRAFSQVRDTPRDWDVLDLRWIDSAGTDHGRTAMALYTCGLTPEKRLFASAPRIDLSTGWPAYWASRTSKHRNNVRRAQRRLARWGEVRFERYQPRGTAYGDDDPRWDLYDACTAIAARSWQGAVSNGNTLSHANVAPFLRDAHLAAVRAGAADIALLYVDRQPIAFHYGYVTDGQVSGLRLGYDAALAEAGAGTALMAAFVEDNFDRGQRTLDLGVDYLECKRPWQTQVAPCQRLLYYPANSPRGQCLRWGRWLGSTLARGLPRFHSAGQPHLVNS